MDTVYFNELSVDPSFSKLADNLSEAKECLLSFVNVCNGYILAKGVLEDLSLATYNNLYFGGICLIPDYSISRLLKELYVDKLIESEEKQRFQLFVNDSFITNWEPEFQYRGKNIYGLGEAHLKDVFALSFNTLFFDGLGTWNDSSYQLEKISAIGSDENVNVKNISTLEHIFVHHSIWKQCKFVNRHPNLRLLPNKNLSDLIPKAFIYDCFNDYYSKQQQVLITVKKTIGNITAVVNGWERSTKCPNQNRPLFEAKNYFLAIDTENSTFEVYSGPDEHEGEIYFNDDNLISKKKDSTRSICGKKGK